MTSPHGNGRACPTSRGLNGLEMSMRAHAVAEPVHEHEVREHGRIVRVHHRPDRRARRFRLRDAVLDQRCRTSRWAPIIIGVISDSTLASRMPRSGHGPNGHSSVITTYAGRPFGLPRVARWAVRHRHGAVRADHRDERRPEVEARALSRASVAHELVHVGELASPASRARRDRSSAPGARSRWQRWQLRRCRPSRRSRRRSRRSSTA